MAAACGAAADVPQNGEKPGVAVDTHAAAARSGFCRTSPPVDEKVPRRDRRTIGLEEDAARSVRTGSF